MFLKVIQLTYQTGQIDWIVSHDCLGNDTTNKQPHKCYDCQCFGCACIVFGNLFVTIGKGIASIGCLAHGDDAKNHADEVAAAQQTQDGDNECLFSPVSIAEIALKHKKHPDLMPFDGTEARSVFLRDLFDHTSEIRDRRLHAAK